MTASVRRQVEIIGVNVDIVSMDDAVNRIAGFVATRVPHLVVTVNPEFIMAARRDAGFRDVLLRADLAVADGIGVVWASWILGRPLAERIGGIDLVEHMAAWAAAAGSSLFLLGAAEGVAATAASRLCGRHAGLRIAGTYAGTPHAEDARDIVSRIRSASPDLLLVAFGAPRQERWISDHLNELGVPVAIGVGGAFDFLAGVVPRAPLFMRQIGLEWLYRLYRQPWRWRRMLSLPEFGALVIATRCTEPRRSLRRRL